MKSTSLQYSLIPFSVKSMYADYRRRKATDGACFETGVAFGQLLAEIDRARLHRQDTLRCLREHANA